MKNTNFEQNFYLQSCYLQLKLENIKTKYYLQSTSIIYNLIYKYKKKNNKIKKNS